MTFARLAGSRFGRSFCRDHLKGLDSELQLHLPKNSFGLLVQRVARFETFQEWLQRGTLQRRLEKLSIGAGGWRDEASVKGGLQMSGALDDGGFGKCFRLEVVPEDFLPSNPHPCEDAAPEGRF